MSFTINPAAHLPGVVRGYVLAAIAAAQRNWQGQLATVGGISSRTLTSVVPHGAPRPEQMEPGSNYAFKQSSADTITVTVTKYGVGMKISDEDKEDEQTAVWEAQASDLGTWTVELPNYLIGEAYRAARPGGTVLGPDGVTVFNTAHPVRGELAAAQSNVLTGTATTVTGCVTDIFSSVTRIRSFRNYSNVVMRRSSNSFVIYAPEAMSRSILEAVTQMQPHPNATDNQAIRMLGATFSVIIDPDLDASSAVDYFVIDASRPDRLPIKQWVRRLHRLRRTINERNDSEEIRLSFRLGESGWDWTAGCMVDNT